MIFLRYQILILLLAFVAACNDAGNDSVTRAEAMNKEKKAKADSTGGYHPDKESSAFLVEVADLQACEIQLAKLIPLKSTQPGMQKVSGVLSRESTQGLMKVKELAAERNVVLPSALSDKMQTDLNALSAIKKEDFESSFLRKIIATYETKISLFKKAVDRVNDQDVRTFASDALPRLEQQLDSIKLVRKLIK